MKWRPGRLQRKRSRRQLDSSGSNSGRSRGSRRNRRKKSNGDLLLSVTERRELWLQSADLLPSWEPRALQFLTLQLAKLDAVGVVECPSKASFPFTTSTSLSAPHVAFETIAVRQGGLLPDFLEPPGGNSRPPKRTHSDLEFFFLLMKLRLCGRWG